jgi:hypothetical protein
MVAAVVPIKRPSIVIHPFASAPRRRLSQYSHTTTELKESASRHGVSIDLVGARPPGNNARSAETTKAITEKSAASCQRRLPNARLARPAGSRPATAVMV